MESRALLALDFGGTKHSAAIAAIGSREWQALQRVPSPPEPNVHTDMALMLGLARDLLAGRTLAAIGVSFGGPVNAATGTVLLSHHVPGWENVPLQDQLRSEFNVPVSVDNDANVAALGEWQFGAGQGCASLLYVTVSTGVGGGWVLDGRVFHGTDSMAGEIGHIVVQPDGPACVCGKRGCVEAIAAGPNLARRARERLAQGVEQELPPLQAGHILRELVGGDLSAVTAVHVARAAQAGDLLACGVLDEAARALGLGLGTAITLMNPQRVVLGGGVTKSGERYWRTVRDTARATVLPGMTLDIVPAALDDDAPLWGAIALAERLL